MIGKTLGHYRIESELGHGGMGVVYKARDIHLNRPVAIKVLPLSLVNDPERERRFAQEAKAASACNHANIVHIYDVASSEGVYFIAMEFVTGDTLDSVIRRGQLPIDVAVEYATQIDSAIEAAHSAGVVHRDLKPSNIIVSRNGHIKVLDFGLAKLLTKHVDPDGSTSTAGPETTAGRVLGTAGYMAPEQALGKPVDARSDIFSFGAVLYQMLAGRPPFEGQSYGSIVSAILRDAPTPLRKIRADVPGALEQIVNRCLEKDREKRYACATELGDALRALRTSPVALPRGWHRLLSAPGLAVFALAIALAIAAGWMYVREARTRRARERVSELSRLIEERKISGAFRLARQIEPYIPNDAVIEKLWQDYAFPVTIRSRPLGAQVSIRPYEVQDGEWERIGRTPIENVRLPLMALRLRIEKQGFKSLDVELSEFNVRDLVLHRDDETPAEMVYVPRGESQFASVNAVSLPEFWIDKYEVTNAEFKRFVGAGGYRDRKYWKHSFVKEGATLSWEQAMGEFRDSTGRPGPAGWELGRYQEGRDQYPVTGVSWYEAAAYAEFVGKALPTVHHWYLAAGRALNPHHILAASNFKRQSLAKAGEFQGVGPFGTFDMAGNAREWCWNEDGGVRYLLGGSWQEQEYLFQIADARPPFDRGDLNGFRCVRYPVLPPEATLARAQRPARDFSKERPVSDDVFAAFARMYSYDPAALHAKVEATEDSKDWRREKIAFDAAYGPERITAYLFLPKNAKPPFQTIMYFPTLDAVTSRSSLIQEGAIRFLVQSGRAVMYPIYKGMHERRAGIPAYGTSAERDRIIYWVKDFKRSVDYLYERNDVDRKIGLYGLSMGGIYGPIMTALDDRVSASVLVAGGLPSHGGGCCFRPQPEVDPFNFASRSHTPTLMVNGKDDFITPFAEAQAPLYRLLGAPPGLKRHAVFEGGHVPNKFQDVIRETLAWYEQHLGHVETGPGA